MCRHRSYAQLLLVLTLASLAIAACSPGALPALISPAAGEELRSRVERAAAEAPPADLQALTAGNTAFALDLYQTLRKDEGNLFFSPHSISLALAMTSAGAASTTAEQMRDTLHFTLSDEQLHAAFNALDAALAREEQITLWQANALWGQRDHPFQPTFLDLLAEHYGAGLRVLDFEKEPEPARTRINDWVAAETEGKIQELLPQGSITPDSRLVLANAIYFKAKWQEQFDPAMTQDGLFTRADGTTVTAPLMHNTASFDYGEGTDYQAVRLPYQGDVAMIVLLPAVDSFAAFEAALSAERLDQILGSMESRRLALTLPRWSYTSAGFQLKPILEGLGMRDAFAPGQADFSGIDGTRQLIVDDVYHKAMVVVDEEGTEAAAATGSSMVVTSAPAPAVEMRVDRPFIFLIRDTSTGALLFVGRIVDPRGE